MPSKRRTRLKILTATYGRDIYLRWGRKARLTLPDGLIRWKITENEKFPIALWETASGKTQIRLYTVILKPKNSTGLLKAPRFARELWAGSHAVLIFSPAAAEARSSPVEHSIAGRLPELYTLLD
ncbi:hypothetical protein GE21DRAFT_1060 [Neurospora crassa]|uniref:Uncharacterized protein n=1 Tax=Neurospora crassa (strain ATCC 24698 / 74-OR23-1A / CBS 708.71 / DSM 1257 / FGSC 987) TaxID=367110 RepID=Q7SDE8_NEUCR|nr:hypothetical protein NCU09323 [Neurospora crassa OR74A]EAA34791.1 hypothetical protein NCU09323 [Neurospora crassa OR74A]KHE83261.1 hypothetical protein GE21DRAFT_1060 [Neurospora crassa]|eukprot:XP_964027.1 hypothetical protein NCU09323 [Neurospora crassa OR74A]